MLFPKSISQLSNNVEVDGAEALRYLGAEGAKPLNNIGEEDAFALSNLGDEALSKLGANKQSDLRDDTLMVLRNLGIESSAQPSSGRLQLHAREAEG